MAHFIILIILSFIIVKTDFIKKKKVINTWSKNEIFFCLLTTVFVYLLQFLTKNLFIYYMLCTNNLFVQTLRRFSDGGVLLIELFQKLDAHP